MNIGIFGGSFDPVHIGHLLMCEQLVDKNIVDKIIFVPTGNGPHKSYDTPAKFRVDMVKLSLMKNDRFIIDTVESDNEKVSYTIDTLRYFSRKYPNDNLFFIIGEDNIYDIETWRDVSSYHNYTEFIMVSRIVADSDTKEQIIYIQDKYNIKINWVKTPLIEISSTEIRKRVRDDRSIRYMVLEDVEEYIHENKLYR